MPSVPPAPCPCPAMRLATAVPSAPQYGSPGVRPVWLRSGPLVTVPVRSGWLGVDSGGKHRDRHALARSGAARNAAGTRSAVSHHSVGAGDGLGRVTGSGSGGGGGQRGSRRGGRRRQDWQQAPQQTSHVGHAYSRSDQKGKLQHMAYMPENRP